MKTNIEDYDIMQNKETKVVRQAINSDEQMQKSLALLGILAISRKSLKEGKFTPIDEAFIEIGEKILESHVR